MNQPSPRAFRTDIQALRGVAILLVLLFHAWPRWCRSGYLGVDIFFVVSGYLITGILSRTLENGSFRFRTFYFRRAKRILPAAYVCFAATAVLSVLLLSARERSDFSEQLLGGVTFTTNFVLWRQTDYWHPAAHLKPLLHIWSLAVEEQFYLLLPAFLALAPRRLWSRLLLLAAVASAVAGFVLELVDPAAAFFLLPARGWELALGSVGALVSSTPSSPLRLVYWPALAALAVVPFLPHQAAQPGVNTLLVCSATLIVILRRHPLADRFAPARKLALVGDFSYSLYLVHWPLFAFARSCWISEPPAAVRLALLGVSFGLGYLLYRTVEKPLWRSEIALSTRSAGLLLAPSLVLAGIAIAAPRANRPAVDFAEIRRANYGLSPDCGYQGEFSPRANCLTSNEPTMLVWGDSLAMALVPGLVAGGATDLIQATSSACGSLLGLAPFDERRYPLARAMRCFRFNDSVLDFLERAPSVETVILASAFGHYVGRPGDDSSGRLLARSDGSLRVRDPDPAIALTAMRRTVASVHALGKRVVVVAPPPSLRSFDAGECLERRASGLPLFGVSMAAAGCRLPVESYRREQAAVLEFLARLSREEKVEVFSFDPFLCDEVSCATERDGVVLYRDGLHFTSAGSETLGAALALGSRLSRLAD